MPDITHSNVTKTAELKLVSLSPSVASEARMGCDRSMRHPEEMHFRTGHLHGTVWDSATAYVHDVPAQYPLISSYSRIDVPFACILHACCDLTYARTSYPQSSCPGLNTLYNAGCSRRYQQTIGLLTADFRHLPGSSASYTLRKCRDVT